LTPAELTSKLEGMDVNVISSGSELAAAIESHRTGRSSWRFLMIVALVLLIIECLFADFLRKRKQTRSRQANPLPESLNPAKNT